MNQELKENLGLKGIAQFEIKHPDGTSYKTPWLGNVITNLGKKAFVGLGGNVDAQTAFSYIALGTSSTAVSATDTTLTAELTTLGLSRHTATVTSEQTTTADDTLQFVYTWTATGSTTVKEAGILNASSNGVLLSHILTTDLPVVNGSLLTATYKIILV